MLEMFLEPSSSAVQLEFSLQEDGRSEVNLKRGAT